MLLTVIIPFYKELDSLGDAVESVIANIDKKYDFEILVCNDGLITHHEILSAIKEDHKPFVCIYDNRFLKGPGGARNTGIEFSKGIWIAFLDADDIWMSGKLDSQLEKLYAGSNFCVTGYRFNDGSAAVSPPRILIRPIDIFLNGGIGTSTVVLSRELIGDTRFNDLRFCQDIDFWFNLAKKKHFKFCMCPEAFVIYNRSGSSKNKFVQFIFFLRVLYVNKISVFFSLRIIIGYFFRGALVHWLPLIGIKKRHE